MQSVSPVARNLATILDRYMHGPNGRVWRPHHTYSLTAWMDVIECVQLNKDDTTNSLL